MGLTREYSYHVVLVTHLWVKAMLLGVWCIK